MGSKIESVLGMFTNNKTQIWKIKHKITPTLSLVPEYILYIPAEERKPFLALIGFCEGSMK